MARAERSSAVMTDAADRAPAPAQRWLARLSFLLLGLAVAFIVVFAGLKSLTLLAAGLAGAAYGSLQIPGRLQRAGRCVGQSLQRNE